MAQEYEIVDDFTEGDVGYVLERELMLASAYNRHTDPTAILLADQPGAGKTVLSSMLNNMFHDDAFFINADDYRRFHPGYKSLHASYGSDVVQMTSKFSSTVTERLIDGASKLGINLIIEGTGRTTKVPHQTAALLTENGYRTEIAAIAVRPVVSLCSTLLRFYNMNDGGTIPRATSVDVHDYIVKVLPGNLASLNHDPLISRLTIWTRTLEKIFDSKENLDNPADILSHYWISPWSDMEIQDAKESIRLLRKKEDVNRFGMTPIIDELERRIQCAEQKD